jgi:hypothetical protein
MWRSLVARLVRDQEVVGSNPIIPTMTEKTVIEGSLFLKVLLAIELMTNGCKYRIILLE